MYLYNYPIRCKFHVNTYKYLHIDDCIHNMYLHKYIESYKIVY